MVTVPYDFVGGTRAIADQVDANFAALVNAFNANTQAGIAASTPFFVSPTGVNSPGAGTSAGSPFASITYAYQTIQANYAVRTPASGAVQVVIQLAPGTYNESVVFDGPVAGLRGPDSILLNGDANNPGSYIINGGPALLMRYGAKVELQGVTLTSPNADCLFVSWHSELAVRGAVVFGSAPNGSHVHAALCGIVLFNTNYSITGNALAHWRVQTTGSQILAINGPLYLPPPFPAGPTITIANAITVTDSFAEASGLSQIANVNCTFVNPSNVTGPKWHAYNGGLVVGAAELPGSVAGITDSASGGVAVG